MDEQEEDKEDEKVWGSKPSYYDAGEHSGEDEVDYKEAERIKKEQEKKLSVKDFGLDDGESDGEDESTKVITFSLLLFASTRRCLFGHDTNLFEASLLYDNQLRICCVCTS